MIEKTAQQYKAVSKTNKSETNLQYAYAIVSNKTMI